jgi:ubiquinone/menaquinone biosynthesis C-methylase UbiE
VNRTDLDEALAAIDGGRMLDVATGDGNMVRYLIDRLKSYDDVVGIDTDDSFASEFADKFVDEPRVRFERMDALTMSFPHESFDTVSMAHALCMFDDAGRAMLLQQMRRMARAGGAIIISDTPRDEVTEPELTHVLLHDWWSAEDIHNGALHRPFQSRADLITHFESLNLRNRRFFDVADEQRDPFDSVQLARIDKVIDWSLGRVKDDAALTARGTELRERMHGVGFLIANALVVVGEVGPEGVTAQN